MFLHTKVSSTCCVVLIFLVVTGWQCAQAQTPAQMEYERQQREYWLQLERQREQQRQQQQQLMNENARRQQEQSSRINAPAGQSSGGFAPGKGLTMKALPFFDSMITPIITQFADESVSPLKVRRSHVLRSMQ